MSNPVLRTLFGSVELRPIAPPTGMAEGGCAYVLLPDLEDLLGVPGFGLSDPICLPGTPRPFDLRDLFKGASGTPATLFH
jgi:hypothetical protein